MAYSNFSLKLAVEQFKLSVTRCDLFSDITAIEPSLYLLETLNISKDFFLISEKERSELLVMPILLDLKRAKKNEFSLYSGAFLDADPSQGLNGECDFILSKGKQSVYVEAPIFCLVEAKKNDIDQSIGQCVAQMLGSMIYNQKEGKSNSHIYGCVTTGTDWQFLKLEQQQLSIHNQLYFINDVPQLLGVLNFIVNEFSS